MEDSPLINSLKGPSLSSQRTTLTDNLYDEQEEEESGWTAYLEDFSDHRSSSDVDRYSSFCPSFSASASLVSDAASRYHGRATSGLGSRPDYFDQSAGPKKLSLIKKMGAKKIAEEDPLEDTASSPVSSPKVDGYKTLDMNSEKAYDSEPSFFGNGGGCSYHRHGLKMVEITDGGNQVDFKGQTGDSCTSLKSRGLCLVHLSLFANYLG